MSEECRLCKSKLTPGSLRDHLRQHHSSEVARVLLFPCSTDANDLWLLNSVQNDVGSRQMKEEPMDEEETSAMTVGIDDESSLEENVLTPRRRRGRPSGSSKSTGASARSTTMRSASAKKDAASKGPTEPSSSPTETSTSEKTPASTRVTRRTSERISPTKAVNERTAALSGSASTAIKPNSTAGKSSPADAVNGKANNSPVKRASNSEKRQTAVTSAASSSKPTRRASRRKRKASESSESEYNPASDSDGDGSPKTKSAPATAEKARNGNISTASGGGAPMLARARVDINMLLSSKQRENRMPTCAICNRIIGQRAAHIYSVHIGKATAKCPLCDFDGQRGQVTHHLRVRHNEFEMDPIDMSAQFKAEYAEWMSKCFPDSGTPQRTLKDLLDPALLSQTPLSVPPQPPKPVALLRVPAPKMECTQCKKQVGVAEAVDHVNTAHAHLVQLTCPIDGCTASSPARRLMLQHMFALHRAEWRWPRSNLFDQAGEMDRHVRQCFGKGLAELKTAAEQVELGERCAVCCREVTRPNRLTHAVAHMNPTGPQLFKCSWCDFATRTDVKAVKQHARLVHGAEGVVSRLDDYKEEIDCWMATCFLCEQNTVEATAKKAAYVRDMQ